MLLTLRTGLVAAAGFVVAVAAFVLVSLELAHTNERIEHDTIVKLAIVEMRFNAAIVADNATNYGLTGRQDRLQIYRDARASLGDNVSRVRELTQDNPVQQAAIDGIDARLQQRLAEFQAVVDARDLEGKEAALALVDQQIAARTFENRTAILGMLAEEDRLTVLRRDRAQRLGAASFLSITAATLCFAFLFIAGWNARRAETQSRQVSDATRAKLEVENASLNERAKIAEFQERFIGVLGHDLRNPLGALAVGIDLLKREVPTEQRTLERMASSARRMSRMIDQLLDLTRSRLGGGIELKP
ncbi:MAG: CHASE3 domain-containing protein, partial [Polyangiaceae bacterium]